MSGRRSRNKGARIEREIVRALQAKGFAASRVPLSGAVGGRFSGDVVLPLLGGDLCVEVNARADGFRELYSWLASRDVLMWEGPAEGYGRACSRPTKADEDAQRHPVPAPRYTRP